MAVYIYLIIVVLTLLFGYLKYQQGYFKRRGIPHDEPHLIYGNTSEYRKTKHIAKIISDVYEKYKGCAPFAGFFLFNMRSVVLLDLELIKNVLIKDFKNFDDRGSYYNEKDDPLTGHLVFMEGEKWRKLRNKLSPTFTSGKIKQMFGTVSKVSEELLSVFGDKIGAASDGKAIEVTDLLSRFTVDVIGTCAFGLECNSLRNPDAEFVRMGKVAMTEIRHSKLVDGLIQSYPKLARKLGMCIVPQKLTDFYLGIVREMIAYREKNHIKRNDFMDMLINLKNNEKDPLSVEELAAQAFIFLVAGYETSSATMSYVLYELAKNQDVQDRLRAEVLEVLEKHKQVFSYECMQDMKYLEMVYSETLRMYSTGGHLIRKTNERYETSDPKYYIDKDTLCIISVNGIHMNPEYYPAPEKFIPERFTPEAIQQRQACTYLPFGDGPRNCIGMRFAKMQMAIGLVSLLKTYRFSVAPETEIPLKFDVKNIALGTVNGIYLKVERI